MNVVPRVGTGAGDASLIVETAPVLICDHSAAFFPTAADVQRNSQHPGLACV